jgi:hypothetical protein
MTVTNLAAVANQVQEFWGSMFAQEFRETHLLPALVSKDYQGDIKQGGDTVYVSQINAPTGENRTIGVDADAFSSEGLTTSRIAIEANKRAVASFEFADLAYLQSQIGQKDSEVRAALLHAVGSQINNYLYSLVAPSTSAPDHSINGVSDMNSTQLSGVRVLAGKAKWTRNKPWYGLLDPTYYGDVMDDTTLASSDYSDDKPIVAGQVVQPRFGFNLLEDNTDGLITHLTAGTAGSGDKAIFFHPDFMHMVMQTTPTFKVSDLHSNKRFGFVISVDVIYGAKLGIDGDEKVIEVYNT